MKVSVFLVVTIIHHYRTLLDLRNYPHEPVSDK
jgi:hypothetical protein